MPRLLPIVALVGVALLSATDKNKSRNHVLLVQALSRPAPGTRNAPFRPAATAPWSTSSMFARDMYAGGGYKPNSNWWEGVGDTAKSKPLTSRQPYTYQPPPLLNDNNNRRGGDAFFDDYPFRGPPMPRGRDGPPPPQTRRGGGPPPPSDYRNERRGPPPPPPRHLQNPEHRGPPPPPHDYRNDRRGPPPSPRSNPVNPDQQRSKHLSEGMARWWQERHLRSLDNRGGPPPPRGGPPPDAPYYGPPPHEIFRGRGGNNFREGNDFRDDNGFRDGPPPRGAGGANRFQPAGLRNRPLRAPNSGGYSYARPSNWWEGAGSQATMMRTEEGFFATYDRNRPQQPPQGGRTTMRRPAVGGFYGPDMRDGGGWSPARGNAPRRRVPPPRRGPAWSPSMNERGPPQQYARQQPDWRPRASSSYAADAVPPPSRTASGKAYSPPPRGTTTQAAHDHWNPSRNRRAGPRDDYETQPRWNPNRPHHSGRRPRPYATSPYANLETNDPYAPTSMSNRPPANSRWHPHSRRGGAPQTYTSQNNPYAMRDDEMFNMDGPYANTMPRPDYLQPKTMSDRPPPEPRRGNNNKIWNPSGNANANHGPYGMPHDMGMMPMDGPYGGGNPYESDYTTGPFNGAGAYGTMTPAAMTNGPPPMPSMVSNTGNNKKATNRFSPSGSSSGSFSYNDDVPSMPLNMKNAEQMPMGGGAW